MREYIYTQQINPKKEIIKNSEIIKDKMDEGFEMPIIPKIGLRGARIITII